MSVGSGGDGPNARYTDRARAAMSAANSIAVAVGGSEILPEHVLAGILSLGESVAAASLVRANVDLFGLLARLPRAGSPALATTDRRLPIGQLTREIIECAWIESARLADDYVGTQHLLLAIVRHARNRAAPVLADFGVTLDGIRAAVQSVISEGKVCERVAAQIRNREYAAAAASCREAIVLNRQSVYGHRQLAWLLSACADAAVRDGPRAVEHAKHACELTGDKDAECLYALAAAHAEVREFTEAVRLMRRAMELTREDRHALGRLMLSRFEAGESWRDPELS